MPPAVTTSPWQAAVDRFSSKTVIGSRLRTAEWAQVPIALRDRALFSAGVENAKVLSAIREKVQQGLAQERPDGIGMNKARFISDMRALLGAAPGDSKSLTDLASVRRLSLIWDFQAADAHAYASYKASLDPDALDVYPAQRLVRIESRRVPRDWYALWAVAGAKVGWVGASKRVLVALKTSPIWAELSRFRRPWPPFDFGSGMGVEDVDRDETEALELLPPNEPPAARLQRLREASAAAQQNWNAGLAASVKGLSTEARDWLSKAFGDQISIEGDQVAWSADKTPLNSDSAAPASDVGTPSTPGGVAPVSNAIQVKPQGALGEHVNAAVSAIDAVHGDGDLPKIPLNTLSSQRALGVYRFFKDGTAESIAIKNNLAAWPALTTAHEIGHFLDHQVLGVAGKFASAEHELLADFRAAVAKSAAFKTMWAELPPSSEFLKPYELWARAYAQFIAVRSGKPLLLSQLDRVRTGSQPWRQWSDADFAPIADAIEALFRKKGWIK